MISVLPIALLALAPLQGGEDEGGWSGAATAGLTYITGNNESITTTVDIPVEYDGGVYKWIFGANYAGVRNEDPVTKDSTSTTRLYQLSAAYDHYLDDARNLYAYASGAARQDKPNGLDIRENLGVGVGHTWRWDEDNSEFNLEAGPSVLKENNVGLASGDPALNGRLAARLNSKLDEQWTLLGGAEFFQSFDETDDRILTADLGARWNFDETWFASGTVALAWDNTPAPTFKKSDWRFVLGIGTTF